MTAKQKHRSNLWGALMVASTLVTASTLAPAEERKLSFTAPGTDTTVTIGGYVKLDAIWSNRSAGVDSAGDQLLNINSVPVGAAAGEHKTNQVTLHARQSRISLATRTPTPYGELKTLVEGDFFGADGNESVSNSSGFRIRHAYGTLGKLSAGQYWTNFFDEQAYPETLDFGGALGEIFVRQAQVRWTEPLEGGGDWSFSLENPESVLAVPGSAALFRSDSDHAPDLAARVRVSRGAGIYSAGLLARNIHVDSAAAPAASSGRWGRAIALTAIIPARAKDDVRLDLNLGNAIGRYQVAGFFPDGYVDETGSIHLAPQMSAFIAYRHFWSAALRSTVELSAATSSPPDGTANGVNKSDRSAHLNLIWSPIPAVDLGAELIHAQRTVVGEEKGSLNRIQFAAKYNF